MGWMREAFRAINQHGTEAARTSTSGVTRKVTGSNTLTRNSRVAKSLEKTNAATSPATNPDTTGASPFRNTN